MLRTEFENNYALYELYANYLKITYKEGTFIDYEAACTIVKDRLLIQSYKAFPILCDITLIEGVSSDAKDYLATYGSALIKSVALVSTLPTLKYMGSYFVAVNKPKITTKVFDSITEAENYIKTQL